MRLTRLVPSPISASWAFAAIAMSFAAGWFTSSSLMMVEASLVTKSFSRWLITILFIPVRGKAPFSLLIELGFRRLLQVAHRLAPWTCA